jgi:hypothetical protein
VEGRKSLHDVHAKHGHAGMTAVILGVSATGSSGSGSTYYVGDTATIAVSAQNSGIASITGATIVSSLDSLIPSGTNVSWAGTSGLPGCAVGGSALCTTINGLATSISNIVIAAGATLNAVVQGLTRGCSNLVIPLAIWIHDRNPPVSGWCRLRAHASLPPAADNSGASPRLRSDVGSLSGGDDRQQPWPQAANRVA